MLDIRFSNGLDDVSHYTVNVRQLFAFLLTDEYIYKKVEFLTLGNAVTILK